MRRGVEREVKVELLQSGMRLLVKPGSQFPVDAEVFKGNTATDESNLTGEATPVEKTVGDTVLAGTINLWGAVEVGVLRPAAESALQKIIQLIKDAQQQKAPAQQFTDKFSTYYTYFVLGLSAVMFFVWWRGIGLPAFETTDEAESAFYRTMTLLVVASPCALVLSIPSAVLAAIAWGARHGVLFRGGAAVEKLADVNVVALDKTGTLTTGELRVEKVESFPPGREDEVAQLAYSLERLSTHPLARAITRYGKQQKLMAIEFPKFESVTGQGLRAQQHGHEILLGRREWVTTQPDTTMTPAPNGPARRPALRPTPGFPKSGWRGTVCLAVLFCATTSARRRKAWWRNCKRCGLRTLVLTGDRRATAEHLKTELHLDEVRAELKPEEKVAAIRELSERGQSRGDDW